ncbi:MAG: hypothetical protein JO089_01755, partial [Alphaproteobacteria bacterium]|nr:hypothetical protein [Alphaproteobacteria bacterium]
MESIFKTILTFLGNTFGNQASGLKPGGILSTGLFTAIGFGVGGIPGLIIGIIVGLLTGGSINTMVDKFLGNSAPETLRIDPNPQDLSKKTPVSVGGKSFDLDRPNLEHLQAPWGKGEEGPAHFLGPLEQDTDRLIGEPIDSQPSKAILDKTVSERNQIYYNYIGSAELLNDKLTHYNKEVRAEWMKTLGIDEKSPLAQTGGPPVYTLLALKLPE